MQINDKVVLITGASRGLGVDMANEFAERGARLALAARSANELESVRNGLVEKGVTAIAIPTDVADRESLATLVDKVHADLGPIDILINNAGIESVEEFEEMELNLIEQIINVNVTGLIELTRLVLPSMIERGTGQIVNIASMAGLVPVPHNSVYSASKHAVVGFSHSLRLEVAEHGVGVSVVCPGFVDGGMFARWGRAAPNAAGSVTPKAVAKATIDATVNNKPEIKVNSVLGKLSPTIHSISPSTSGFLMTKTGVADFLRKQAAINAKENRDA